MKDRVQVWMSREEFQALKGFLESTDLGTRSTLMDLYSNVLEAESNNSNHEPPEEHFTVAETQAT
jgi:hypothetical protein